MTTRFPISGSALRRTRIQHGYPSARLLGNALGLSIGQVYDLEHDRTNISEDTYRNLLDLFGLPDGALKVSGIACPYCGHPETEDRKSLGVVTNAA
ncbi:helix-turn-helix transcriptional regulator [Nocardiopsis eucommiae]|uniref:Helix-turn-helix transcriptional regulator n=1 Tax=Nocardiopsis eucommiae TaxID=2831970 RepID=A0A975QJR8_9ACTN|nr:helix-turn-helix transcriptional regulator [Nocardiopsis eucommiae]